MLHLHSGIRVLFVRAIACCTITMLPIVGLNARPIVYAMDEDPIAQVKNFVGQIAAEQDVNELINLIIELRDCLIAQGHAVPSLRAILQLARAEAYVESVFIDDAIFEALEREFEALEEQDRCCELMKHKHKHHKQKKKEFKVSARVAVGFLKFTAGALLCLIPVPIVQGAGASLAVLGVNDMLDASREESDKRDADERFDANRRIDASQATMEM